ncbi:MAG: ABC transporter ATP-binding protein [Deltaproteobacteria bacterium]|jgi:ABC-2 type transport system ATP-binding protein|nr:ABC transporter ATP-binding protein [Deltaproteobacteria bacterium]
MIKIRELKKSYGQIKALDSLDLDVAEGELFAFLGPNGAGKTTTIRILTGLTRFDCGAAIIGGIDITKDPLKVKSLCGLVTQHNNLDGELTVWENLDIHGRLYGLSAKKRRESFKECLACVEMSDRASSLVKTLSGGLKRRLMIARALSHGPKVLFLDEPTAGLDPAIRRRVWSLIKKINLSGVTVFLTTHYIEEAEFLAGRVAFINRGRLVESGVPASVMERFGQWAVDCYGQNGLSTSFFEDRLKAAEFIRSLETEGTLRRVNLEDAFLALTGRRVEGGAAATEGHGHN